MILLASLALAASSASSVLTDDAKVKHTADLATDGLLMTGWAEGAMGHGDAAWIEIDLGTKTKLEDISFWPGNLSDGKKSFREYARPKLVKIYVDGVQVGEPVRLQDEMVRVDVPVDVTGQKVKLEAVEVFEGGVFADLYISEIAVNFTEGERAKAVDKVKTWIASKEGQAVATKYEEQVLAAYTKHKENSDEQEGLAFLMEAAGDGAEYLQKKVTSLVPVGYRAAAIVPDDLAMQAIRKLKDANGIPGLEMAALRAIGKDQKQIRSIIEYFYAWQDLQSGGRRNIQAWGEPGFEPGALRGWGEPLAVELDSAGNVIVADTGNNRIQRYTPQGVSDRQWGAEKDVVEWWFGGRRTWYASGGGASDKGGAFLNPVDVELIKEKDGDMMITLDAAGRVQIFDAEGNPVIGWKVNTETQIQPKVGGEGYLAWVAAKKQLLVILEDEAYRYNLEAEELGKFKVQDGTPTAVESAPDGKLYMAFGKKIVSYNPDGFRYQVVIDEKTLGEGFEDIDVTVDEKGKLWVLTDLGWLYSFKSPGKLDWKLKVSEVELERPRLAVYQGQALITDRDRILPVDALQQHTDEVEAEKNGVDKDGNPLPEAEGKKKKK